MKRKRLKILIRLRGGGGITKYNILNGESQIGTIVKPTKVGRKKKLNLDKIIEGGNEIPPIKNNQSLLNRDRPNIWIRKLP